MDFRVINQSGTPTGCALPSAKQLGREVASVLPGAIVSVLRTQEAAVGLFQLGNPRPTLGPEALIDRIRELDLPVQRCSYPLATADQLESMIAVPDPLARSFKLRGFVNLTPSFMKNLANKRPGLMSLDMRETHGTAELIEAFLEEHQRLVDEENQHSGQRLRELFQERSSVNLQQAAQMEKSGQLDAEILVCERQISNYESVLEKGAEKKSSSEDIQIYVAKLTQSLEAERERFSQLQSEKQELEKTVAALSTKLANLQDELGKIRNQAFLLGDLVIAILAQGSDITAEQKQRLEKLYPQATIIDGGSTLDLSDGEWTFDQIRRKLAAGYPSVKNVDLSQSKGIIDLFDVLKLEVAFRVNISYSPPNSWTVPKQNSLSGILRPTTSEDIVRVVERFPTLESVNARNVKGLSRLDVVCFKQLFPNIDFAIQADEKIELPFFDERVTELLSKEFPQAEIEFENMTLVDELDLMILVSHFTEVNYIYRRRSELLVQSSELLKFHLHHSLNSRNKTQLSNDDLEQLAIQCSDLESVTKAVIEFRANPHSHSVYDIKKMIDRVDVKDRNRKRFETQIDSVPYAMRRLVESIGSFESRKRLPALPVPTSQTLEEQLQEISAISERSKETPLHVAAYKGYREAVISLLQKGVAHKIRNAAGYLPIDLARQAGHLTVMDYILDHAAEVRRRAAFSKGTLIEVLKQQLEALTEKNRTLHQELQSSGSIRASLEASQQRLQQQLNTVTEQNRTLHQELQSSGSIRASLEASQQNLQIQLNSATEQNTMLYQEMQNLRITQEAETTRQQWLASAIIAQNMTSRRGRGR